MATSRYSRSDVVGAVAYRSTPQYIQSIRDAVDLGTLQYREIVTSGAQRLDTIAGKEYGDGRYWWVIAAASSIGWGLQIPPGTVVKVPNLSQVLSIVA